MRPGEAGGQPGRLGLAAAGGGRAPSFEREGQSWPQRESSRFVEAAGLRWHVQVQGAGPVALLLHGTGAASHSWRGLAPRLAGTFTTVAPDLPGHGFTALPPPSGLTLPGMAAGITALLKRLELSPAIAVGHSAGAAILIRMTLDRAITPRHLVSLNGALLPFGGMAGKLFAPAARLLARSRLASTVVAWRAEDPAVIARLLASTGSRLDAEGAALYGQLASRPTHVGAALGMMAGWDLAPLLRDLPRLQVPLTLVVGGKDRMVPPGQARDVRKVLPGAELVRLPGLGHLAHEERPDEVADLVLARARQAGVIA